MLNSERFLLDLLRKKITTSDGAIVPVIKRSYPLDKTPCICLDNSGGANIIQKFKLHNPQEYLVDRTQSYVNIHLYANNEDQRHYLMDRIREAIHLVEQDHYKYCSNLTDNNVCETTGTQCAAIGSETAKGYKHQCPDPEEYEYENLFTKYNIIRGSFQVDPAFDTDDLTKKPVLLHSVFKTSMIYDDKYLVGGKLSDTMSQETTINGDI